MVATNSNTNKKNIGIFSLLLSFIVSPLQMLKWCIRFYFTHPLLIGLASVFTSIRVYEKYTANNPYYLDIIVELARLAFVIAFLVLAIREIGKFWRSDFSWRHFIWKVVESIWIVVCLQYFIFDWVNIIVNFLVQEASVSYILNATNLTFIDSSRLTDAIIFAFKNFLLLPMFYISWIRVLLRLVDRKV